MKKIAMAIMVTGLAFTAACGGSSWSDEDKADLQLGLSAAEALGLFTDAQSDCVADWLQSNYDSMADVEAAPEEDGLKMFDACDISVEDLENWSWE